MHDVAVVVRLLRRLAPDGGQRGQIEIRFLQTGVVAGVRQTNMFRRRYFGDRQTDRQTDRERERERQRERFKLKQI